VDRAWGFNLSWLLLDNLRVRLIAVAAMAGLRTGGRLAEITKKAEEKKPVFTARSCVSQIRR
jgi:hypothetical protein